jgi:arylsulfatase A-like enzyme
VNVLLVIIDCLRADRLGLANSVAPNLDALAEAACVFSRAYTNGPYTRAAVPGLLCSAYYSDFLVRRKAGPVRTIIQAFQDAGYVTMGVQANAYLYSDLGWGRGFDYLDESVMPWFRSTPRAVLDASEPTREAMGELRGLAERALLYLLYCKGAIPCTTANRKLASMIRRHYSPGRGHFLLVHYMDLHEPIVLPGRWRAGLPRLHAHVVSEKAHRAPEDLTPTEWQFLADSYDRALSWVDHELASLMRRPEVKELLGDGLLVITADHGEELGEHGRFGHSTRFYEELLHVPLLMRLPGQRERRDIACLARHIDLGPTLLDLCGLPPEPAFVGRSLARYVLGVEADTGPEPPLIAEARISAEQMHYSVQHGGFKLTQDPRELYDLSSDPAERRNLIRERPEVAERLTCLLSAHRQGAVPESAGPEVAPVRLRDRLRSLGYLE